MQVALLLNSTYEPLKVISWQRAVTMLCLDKVEVVESYRRKLRAVTWQIPQPAVVRLVHYVKRHRVRIRMSRRQIFTRDGGICQYCRCRLQEDNFTFDHVLPRSRGGATSWENVVAACGKCNRKKANRTPKEARMALLSVPRKPQLTVFTVMAALRSTGPIPEQWRDFVRVGSNK